MKVVNRVAYLIWPLALLLLASAWSWLKYGTLHIDPEWYDTAAYLEIAQNGYGATSLSAYFPGFPFLWRLLSFPAWGMAIVNAVLWLSAVVALDLKCGIRRKALVIASVMPQVVFFAIPYAESLFFVAGTIVAFGLVKKDLRITTLGIFIAALIRPNAVVFVPALFLARWFSGEKLGTAFRRGVPELLATLGGVALSFYLQSRGNGDFFGFFDAQEVVRRFGWPTLPLESRGGSIVTLMDGTAVVTGLFAGRTLWHTRRGGQSVLTPVERLGLAGMFVTAFLFLAFGGGQIASAGRMVFATVFFPLALSAWSHTVFQKRELPLLFIGWMLFSLALGSLRDGALMAYYIGAGLVIYLVLNALRSRELRWLSIGILLLLSAAAVVFFYQAGRYMG
jgi:hypothetical protein